MQILLISVFAAMASRVGMADPFSSCPSQAFLVQDTTARLYGVNLATGYYELLSDDLGTSERVNGLAFNFHDNYLYGWDYANGTLARITSNYEVVPLPILDLPDANFYVGDIAVHQNSYFFYRPGHSFGLYKVELDRPAGTPLRAERIVDGSTLNIPVFDLAFHPTNSFAYAVSRSGALYEIDTETGGATVRGNVGVTGTFGAAYFDVDGYLYISRNSDGQIFRIDLTASAPSAEFFAYGPASNNNDGARCAMAPIIPVDNSLIDFGDAPDSFGTTLSTNGARHDLGNGQIYLGQTVDGESDAWTHPLADDTADASNDDDGVVMVSNFDVGRPAILIAESSAPAFLNAWIDWNQSGQFDPEEKVFSQLYVDTGENNLLVDVPIWAKEGSTWARFRISSTPEVGPIGGVGDGEVEDYQITVSSQGTTVTSYPAAGEWITTAFEDNWPLIGDFDMNDLVVHLRTEHIALDGTVVGLQIEGEVAAVGGDYHNGFAIRLEGIDAASIAPTALQFWINDIAQTTSPLENSSGDAVFVVMQDAWDYVTRGEGCRFYRTEAGCESDVQMSFKLRIAFLDGVPESSFPAPPFDPFLFATPGHDRSYVFTQPPGRGLEIHLPGKLPTDRFDATYLNLADDHSDPANNVFFRTDTGMPWALQIGARWSYPLEFIDVDDAYPLFEPFVSSGGQTFIDWYIDENAADRSIFPNSE
ncbi:MAG: LruC domain-containing protein [Pseudomonadota bacterium]